MSLSKKALFKENLDSVCTDSKAERRYDEFSASYQNFNGGNHERITDFLNLATQRLLHPERFDASGNEVESGNNKDVPRYSPRLIAAVLAANASRAQALETPLQPVHYCHPHFQNSQNATAPEKLTTASFNRAAPASSHAKAGEHDLLGRVQKTAASLGTAINSGIEGAKNLVVDTVNGVVQTGADVAKSAYKGTADAVEAVAGKDTRHVIGSTLRGTFQAVSHPVETAGQVAKAGSDVLAKAGHTVTETVGNIQSGISDAVKDPGKTFTNLTSSVSQGIQSIIPGMGK